MVVLCAGAGGGIVEIKEAEEEEKTKQTCPDYQPSIRDKSKA
jgi:hypothetical protein